MADVARRMNAAPMPTDRSPPVAVIGGGWAGCAAAVELAAHGVPVTLYEAAPVLGGRARRVERDGLPLDNGQHLLLGAYASTLAMLARVHGEAGARDALLRRPLAILPFGPPRADALELRARRAPGRLGLLAGLLFARGLSWRERVTNIAWFRDLERSDFHRPPDETVAGMLASLPPRVARLLWEPLCIAALNTPVAAASAQVYANVLRAAFAPTHGSSDFLLPATDLSALFPEAAARHLARHGGRVRTGARARIVAAAGDGVTLEVDDRAERASAVVVAVGPHQLRQAFARESLSAHPPLPAAIEVLETLAYEPIVTVWLGYATRVDLPGPIARLDDSPGHWLIDRPDVLARGDRARHPPLAQLVSVAISAEGPHTVMPQKDLAQAVDAQLRRLSPALPRSTWSQVIAEKRATYACTPGRAIPCGPCFAPGVFVAGDYVDALYPATLEAAVRSGIAAAAAVRAELR